MRQPPQRPVVRCSCSLNRWAPACPTASPLTTRDASGSPCGVVDSADDTPPTGGLIAPFCCRFHSRRACVLLGPGWTRCSSRPPAMVLMPPRWSASRSPVGFLFGMPRAQAPRPRRGGRFRVLPRLFLLPLPFPPPPFLPPPLGSKHVSQSLPLPRHRCRPARTLHHLPAVPPTL